MSKNVNLPHPWPLSKGEGKKANWILLEHRNWTDSFPASPPTPLRRRGGRKFRTAPVSWFNNMSTKNVYYLSFFLLQLPPSLKLRWTRVEANGVEPMTSWMQIRRSSQLSYAPKIKLQIPSFKFQETALVVWAYRCSPGQSWTADLYIISVAL